MILKNVFFALLSSPGHSEKKDGGREVYQIQEIISLETIPCLVVSSHANSFDLFVQVLTYLCFHLSKWTVNRILFMAALKQTYQQ